MPKIHTMVLAALRLVFAVTPAFAHHAFTAEFDGREPIELKGTITRVEWVNPHIYLYMDVKDASGKVTNWAIEGGPTRHMRDAGITKNFVDSAIGQTVDMWAYPSKNGHPLVYLKKMTFSDGHFFAYYTDSSDHSGKGDIVIPPKNQ